MLLMCLSSGSCLGRVRNMDERALFFWIGVAVGMSVSAIFGMGAIIYYLY